MSTGVEPAGIPRAGASERSGSSTFPSNPTRGWDRFERTLRAVSIVVILGIVIGALLGFAGLTTGTRGASAGILEVEVEYATVSRPGLATPLVIDIRSGSGPLPAEVSLEIPRAYLSMFDENGLDPAPDSITSDGATEIWTFDTQEVPTLSIDFDARLQPNMHYDRDGWVIVRAGNDEVRVDFTTRVMP